MIDLVKFALKVLIVCVVVGTVVVGVYYVISPYQICEKSDKFFTQYCLENTSW